MKLALVSLLVTAKYFAYILPLFSPRVVRMSSPMINNVVLLGCFFCYVFVFLLGIDARFVDDHVFGVICNVSRVLSWLDLENVHLLLDNG